MKLLLNVDECMSNAPENVFSILISYLSEKEMHSAVQHHKSQTFSVVNAKNI